MLTGLCFQWHDWWKKWIERKWTPPPSFGHLKSDMCNFFHLNQSLSDWLWILRPIIIEEQRAHESPVTFMPLNIIRNKAGGTSASRKWAQTESRWNYHLLWHCHVIDDNHPHSVLSVGRPSHSLKRQTSEGMASLHHPPHFLSNTSL
jgi:hypothetical protein